MVVVCRFGIAGGVRGEEHVVLAPHDSARQAGRAAGVDQDLVVAAASARRKGSARCRACGVLVAQGPVRAGRGAVFDADPCADIGAARPYCLGLGQEASVEHNGGGISVGPQLHQFIAGIAVVGVDRHQRGFEGSEGGFHVGRSVVQVERDLVLRLQSGTQQRLRHAVGAAVEVAPRKPFFAVNQRRAVRNRIGDRFPHIGKRPLQRGSPTENGAFSGIHRLCLSTHLDPFALWSYNRMFIHTRGCECLNRVFLQSHRAAGWHRLQGSGLSIFRRIWQDLLRP